MGLADHLSIAVMVAVVADFGRWICTPLLERIRLTAACTPVPRAILEEARAGSSLAPPDGRLSTPWCPLATRADLRHAYQASDFIY